MSEEIATANADLAEMARLMADVASRDQTIAQQDKALTAERAARVRAEANAGWWHATVANYVTSATTADRAMLRGVLAEATTYANPGAPLMAELALLRELAADVQRWREAAGDPRDLRYILETMDKLEALKGTDQ